MSRRTAPRAVVLACLASLLTLAGCTSAYDLPLPGGAANSGPVFRITAEFEDVLDLVPQSSVKVDDVTVGSVERIEVRGWVARVTMRLPASLKLPDNATAELRQTSLLGEKFVQLAPPATGATGTLSDGDDIPLARTTRNPEVEEVLGALSLLLNGGGVGQLKIIETELNDALRGNSGAIRDLVTQLNTFVGGLDQQKSEIVRAIDNIDKLSGTLAAQKDLIGQALDQIPVGLKILADQREQLTRLLKALSDLGAVGTKVIAASKDDLEANLRSLGPILGQLAAAGDDLPTSLQLFLTYPFPDQALQVIKGDYVNLHLSLDANLGDVLGNLSTGLGKPTGTGLPQLPGLPTLPGVPGAPTVPTLPSTGSAGSSVPSWATLFPTGGAR
ncbi:MCE family protein [Lapillicoccus jejuensis]|uniref:Phospholipid/cholesterol/gamma-HCH transport system substrate-binding protein n=1 Tax=Lapillicoccus jejuensis TaxID=402171 RepID=A0A542DWR1_9MICO|nr:MCE family protein [Lapillicoccus jejuensis]TQJ07506.1 phospholipid/cholesterol/gamma-HCH transport system substrate-binding protein [Lapillicoccus jejuensis]